MSDGREEREDRKRRIEQQKLEDPAEPIDPDEIVDWEPERVDS